VLTVVLSLCIGALLLVGILKECPVAMLPAMIIMVCASKLCEVVQCKTNSNDLQIIQIVACVVVGVILIIPWWHVPSIIAGFMYLLAVLLQIWFFTVVFACYRYLRDKLNAKMSLPTAYVTQTNLVRFDFCMYIDWVSDGRLVAGDVPYDLHTDHCTGLCTGLSAVA
jgi:hypothetical protein